MQQRPVQGNFYFIKDSYYNDFPDEKVMCNKPTVDGQPHGRPCFFAFEDTVTGILWLIPISSRIEKYHLLESKIRNRYHFCDTILFGDVLGQERAFLIQNMCPLTDEYLDNQYVDRNKVPVRVDGAFEKRLIKTAKAVLAKAKAGVRVLYTDALETERKLLSRDVTSRCSSPDMP